MVLLDLPKKLIKLVKRSQIHWQWLIIVSGFIAAMAVTKPILWPDGFGINADKSVTTTVEKDPQGKITKTVETTKIDPGKTLWDWLSLLGVPITLAVLGYRLQHMQQKRAEKVAEDQRKLAANETKEEVLQVYYDRLSVLLVDKNLRALAAKVNSEEPEKSKATPEEQEQLDSAVDVIRARTLSILRRFENDIERKTSVIRFLIEADFISKLKLNLSSADLRYADLRYADLRHADLRYADLRHANLNEANLSEANFRRADLSKANLSEANLSEANFSEADLRRANLSTANLSTANFIGVNLSSAYLGSANLRGADLRGAILGSANLTMMRNFSAEQIKSAVWENALYYGILKLANSLDWM
jgi:uncharacterized protein YjbI with pentapeptide repeats